MPETVFLHTLEELSHPETPNKVLIRTTDDTELSISVVDGKTVIRFSFGNKFDIIGGNIIVHNY